MSAWSSFWKVRSIPILSIASCVSRMPAVSMKRKVIPPMLIVSSMTSRVVPWMSLTIALSSFSRTFSRVDFPAFVSPMIATGMPFLIAFPTLKELARRDMMGRQCAEFATVGELQLLVVAEIQFQFHQRSDMQKLFAQVL